MSRPDPIAQRVLRIAEPVCAASGYEVVDVRFTTEPGGWVLRVMIDRLLEPGERIDLAAVPSERVDLEDCERISRELSAVLDVEDPIPQAYALEVSSPGIDRPLRTPEHFRRYVGAEVKIVMGVPVPVPSGSGERRNFKGELVAVEPADPGADDPDADPVAVVLVDGKDRFRLRVADVESARLVPDWDAVLKGGSGLAGAPATPHRRSDRGAKAPDKAPGRPKPRA